MNGTRFSKGTNMPPSISIDLTLDAPVDRVWRAWTDSSDLTAWLTTEANVRAEADGPYELFWEPEHPERNSTLGCQVTSMTPMKEISFTWKGPVPYADLMNGEPPPTHVNVRFDTKGPKTFMHFEHLGWGTGQRWEEARAWQEQAWRKAFAQLGSFLSGPRPRTAK